MITDDKADVCDSSTPPTRVEPPKIYIPACGALCDIFWWARRDPPVKPPAFPVVKDETP